MACPYNCKNGKVFNPALRIWQDCPNCAGVLSELSSAVVTVEQEDAINALMIPDRYRSVTFSMDNFFEPDVYQVFLSSTLPAVLEKLKSIESSLLSGAKPNESCYFFASNYANILAYVYHCLKTAVKHGLSAVPYISLLDLKGLRNSVFDVVQELNAASYMDYVRSDVCFLAANASTSEDEAAVLADLLSERERRGLATIVFGYWSVPALKKAKRSLYFLIRESGKLSALKPYEVKTKQRVESEESSGGVKQPVGSLANPIGLEGSLQSGIILDSEGQGKVRKVF